MSLKIRVKELREYYLPDIERRTGSRVSVSTLVNSKKTLDLGCGSGAYIRVMRDLGSRGQFVGVDFVKYSGDNACDGYEQLIIGDIRSKEVLEQLKQHNFDCIVSIGLSPKALDFVARNRGKLQLTQGGLMVLITDHDITGVEYADFDVYHGKMGFNRSILVGK